MIRSSNILAVQDALIALVVGDPEELTKRFRKVGSDEVLLSLAPYGFDVNVRDLSIPVEAAMIDNLVNAGRIIIYAAGDGDYAMRPALEVTLPCQSLMEAKGAWTFACLSRQRA